MQMVRAPAMLSRMNRSTALAAAVLAGVVAADAAELEVPREYPTIQAAINAAAAGDTVLIEPGTYTENITMASEVVVRGRETARTLLGPSTGGVTVLMQGIGNATLANLTIVDSSVGVRVVNGADLGITNVVFDGATDVAVDIDLSATVDVEHCVFFENAVAIRRLSGNPAIVNNVFAANTVTLASPLDVPASNIEFNGFFDNDDLKQGDIDTALGTDFTLGDPRFVDVGARDFHLRSGSPAIDAGTGTDVIDGTVADLGAHGGEDADTVPFPVAGVRLSNASAASPPPFAIAVSWTANLDYRVSGSGAPGTYRVYYRLDQPGPPYDGSDAGGGTQPSPIDAGLVTNFVLNDLSPAADNPLTPFLRTAEPRNEGVALTWDAVASATGYTVLYGVNVVGERSFDAGNSTRTTVTGLENGQTYRFAVTATRQPAYHVAVTALDGTQDRNESAFSADQRLALGPASASAPSNELTAAPDVTVPVPDLPDKGCFVATAAYGASWEPQVEILRDFRDRYLSRLAPGRLLIDWYYAHGPTAAAALQQHKGLKPMARAALTPLVWIALVVLATSAAEKLVLAALLLLLIGRRRVEQCVRGAAR